MGGDHGDGLVAFVEGLEGLNGDFLPRGGDGADGGVGGVPDGRGCCWDMVKHGSGGCSNGGLYSCARQCRGMCELWDFVHKSTRHDRKSYPGSCVMVMQQRCVPDKRETSRTLEECEMSIFWRLAGRKTLIHGMKYSTLQL